MRRSNIKLEKIRAASFACSLNQQNPPRRSFRFCIKSVWSCTPNYRTSLRFAYIWPNGFPIQKSITLFWLFIRTFVNISCRSLHLLSLSLVCLCLGSSNSDKSISPAIMGVALKSHKFHVLAVDDSLIDRKLIERLLQTSSYRGNSFHLCIAFILCNSTTEI